MSDGINAVELIANESDCAFDQRCRFGNRVAGHAVYCQNDAWKDSPRKCRRSWYTNGEVKDEDCPGFERNPKFVGDLSGTALGGQPCIQCLGTKLMTVPDGVETCSRCCGDGAEPVAMQLTSFAQDTLEFGCGLRHDKSGDFETVFRVLETQDQRDQFFALGEDNLIRVRSIGGHAGAAIVTYCLTGKGAAVMRANWAAKHSAKAT